MDCWEILGIEPVKEESAIKAAYFEKLKTCNPEEDPNGFMKLRKALEEALESLKEPEMMDTPEIRELSKKLNDLYSDFSARIDEEAWRELLRLPICQELGREEEVNRALLAFIMDHFRIPHKIVKLLSEHFAWQEKKEELEEHFPEGFIGFLMNHAEYEDPIDYYSLPILEDFDYDGYIGAFYRMSHAVGEQDKEAAEEALKTLEEYGLENPDQKELAVRYNIYVVKEYETAWELAKELLEQHGGGGTRRLAYGRAGLAAEKMEEIAWLMEEMKDSADESEVRLYADYLYYNKKYEEALKYFQKARSMTDEEWPSLEDGIRACYGKLSEIYEKELEESGEVGDPALTWKTAESCYRGGRFEKARELLNKVEPQKGREREYYTWLANCCREAEDYLSASKYRKELEAFQDQAEDPVRVFWDIGCDLEDAEQYEEALSYFARGQEKDPESWIWLYKKAEILYYQDKDDESIELCDKVLTEWGFVNRVFDLKIKNLFDKRDYDALISDAEHVLRQGYQSFVVYFDYAVALRKKGRIDDAMQYLNRLIEENGEDGVACEELSRAYQDKKEYEEALKWADKAIGFEETPPRKYLKADILSDLSRYEEEKAIYEEIVESGSAYYHTYYRLAYAMEQLGEYEQAEVMYRKSLEERPDNYWARCSLADTLQKLKRWEDAVVEYKKAMENPDYHKWCVWNLARLLRRMRRLDEAYETILSGMDKFPDQSCLVSAAARICRSRKDYEAAAGYYVKYAEMREDEAAFGWRCAGDCYAELKAYERAEMAYQKAIDTDEEDDSSWRFYGEYYLDTRKDPQKALEYLLKAVELDEFDGNYKELGRTYEKLGEPEKAKECFEKALELARKDLEEDSRSSCNYWSVGQILYYLGRYEEAIEAAAGASPYVGCFFNCPYCECQEAYEVIAMCHARMGHKEEALSWFAKAKELDSELSDDAEEMLKGLKG